MGRVVQLPAPPTQHVHIEAEIPGGFVDPITLFSAQPHCFMFELCCISLPLLCHHGTPPEIIISLFSRCPFLLNHNSEYLKHLAPEPHRCTSVLQLLAR